MKTIVLVAALAIVSMGGTGCAARQGPIRPGIRPQKTLCVQVCVQVTVKNDCALYLTLESDQIEAGQVPFKTSYNVVLESTAYSGSSRTVFLTARGYGANGRYLGSEEGRWSLSIYDGSYKTTWTPTHLSLPNGKGGCEVPGP